MSTLRHFYQVNILGEPIQGSNVNIKNKPKTFGRGQRWVEFISAGQAQPCCDDGPLVLTSIGKKWRFYVRLRNPGVVGDKPTPVAGTLMKHQQKPSNGDYRWQEIIGRHQCATIPQWNATLAWGSHDDPKTIDLSIALGLSTDYYTFTVLTNEPTNEAHMTVDLNIAGVLTITQNNVEESNTDTITLHYSNGDCTFAFQMTFVYTV